MWIRNLPTDENPNTGKITALDVIRLPRWPAGPMRVGA